MTSLSQGMVVIKPWATKQYKVSIIFPAFKIQDGIKKGKERIDYRKMSNKTEIDRCMHMSKCMP